MFRRISHTLMLILLSLVNEVHAGPGTLVSGTVRDASGAVLAGAAVYLRGSNFLSFCDLKGRFRIQGAPAGEAVLVVTCSGFRAQERVVLLGEQPVELDITLELEVPHEDVRVTAYPHQPEPVHLTQLTPLAIVRMPGASADLYRALQMQSGVAKVDDGAGLFVRGGEAGETKTYLDRALLEHSYRCETPNGGMFGTVRPFMLSGISLSTGGFPARFGNALSGVLELQSVDRPQKTSLTATAGLAALSGSLSLPVGDSTGLRFSGNQSLTRLLFKLNSVEQHFDQYPSGTDFSLNFYADGRRAGSFKGYLFDSQDQIGVELERELFTGILNSSERNGLASLAWQKTISNRWFLEGSISRSRYAQHLEVGIVELHLSDTGKRARLDLTGHLEKWTLRAGGEFERQAFTLSGLDSSSGGDLGGIQGVRRWTLVFDDRRLGGYAELERSLGRLSANVGLRGDYFGAMGTWIADPRLSINYRIAPAHRLRLAWGLYHQAPAPAYLDRQFGNPRLRPMSAQHWIAGYTIGKEDNPVFLRFEGYTKAYARLPVEDRRLNFSDHGDGFARGFDVFARLFRGSRWEAWTSYSYVVARRRYTRLEDRGRYELPERRFRPEFEIPHTLQWVFEGALTPSITLAGSFRLASGRPFTPVVGARTTEKGHVPIYGELNSQRYPTYHRLDLNLSRTYSLAGKAALVQFLGLTNVLGRRNVFDYAYSQDFSERRPARSAWGRTFYFGISLLR